MHTLIIIINCYPPAYSVYTVFADHVRRIRRLLINSNNYYNVQSTHTHTHTRNDRSAVVKVEPHDTTII